MWRDFSEEARQILAHGRFGQQSGGNGAFGALSGGSSVEKPSHNADLVAM